MELREPRLFIEAFFAKSMEHIMRWTADVQAGLVPRFISAKYDCSECRATMGILVAALILIVSWIISEPEHWLITIMRFTFGALALWYVIAAFSYPLKVGLVDLPAGGGLRSPVRSVILLFFNYTEITIHFASFYLLSQSIQDSGTTRDVTSALTSLYFSIVTITTLGDGSIRPVWWMGRALVSIEALVGLILIVTVLAGFLSKCIDRGKVAPLQEQTDTPVQEGAKDQEP